MMVCGWTQSDVTASLTKLPYKATFLPNKGMKKKVWSARFSKLSENRVDHSFFYLNAQTITNLKVGWITHFWNNAI